MKTRSISLAALVFAAYFVGVWATRAETQPASNASAYFAPSGKDRVIHRALEQLIRSAQKSVDIAIFQFTSRDLASAVDSAAGKVRVRVVADVEQAQGGWTQVNALKGRFLELRTVRVPGEDGTEGQPKFHHKFCVVDGETVATGSFNWTCLADEQNHENLLILHDSFIAGQYEAQFERIWADERIVASRRGEPSGGDAKAPEPQRNGGSPFPAPSHGEVK